MTNSGSNARLLIFPYCVPIASEAAAERVNAELTVDKPEQAPIVSTDSAARACFPAFLLLTTIVSIFNNRLVTLNIGACQSRVHSVWLAEYYTSLCAQSVVLFF